MADDPKETAGERDLTKHFEAILGREIDVEDAAIVLLREYLGSYWTERGSRTSREVGTTGSSSKRCSTVDLLTVDGLAATRADGTREFLVSDFHCLDVSVRQPIIALATVQRRSPVFVTIRATATPDARDVRIEIFTWNPDGSPAGNVLVHWLCRFPSSPFVT
jgi:hypothetical protein